jgi:PelA/Pel-15E family pectate lyase
MTPAWFHTDSARALALRLLSWQTPAGGWSKHVDMRRRARAPGESFYGESDEWHYIATFDNDATTTELRIIGGVANALSGPADAPGAESARGAEAARKPASESEPESEPGRSAASEPGHPRPRPDSDSDSDSERARLRAAFLRGLGYIFAAQCPNGCFPQVYPLQGGYHDAATFNDNATVNVLRLLRDVARGQYGFVPASARRRARAAFHRGLDCVLRSQVVVRGVRTVWGQQHDPLTLRPAPARSYELAGLAGRESAWILDFLMELPEPSPRVVAAVHAGAAWFQAHALRDYAYGADQVLRPSPGAGPIWARNTDIATMRPMFANRDGVKLFDWSRLTDRRAGYGWFGTEPRATLATYRTWALRYPRSPTHPTEEAP